MSRIKNIIKERKENHLFDNKIDCYLREQLIVEYLENEEFNEALKEIDNLRILLNISKTKFDEATYLRHQYVMTTLKLITNLYLNRSIGYCLDLKAESDRIYDKIDKLFKESIQSDKKEIYRSAQDMLESEEFLKSLNLSYIIDSNYIIKSNLYMFFNNMKIQKGYKDYKKGLYKPIIENLLGSIRIQLLTRF